VVVHQVQNKGRADSRVNCVKMYALGSATLPIKATRFCMEVSINRVTSDKNRTDLTGLLLFSKSALSPMCIVKGKLVVFKNPNQSPIRGSH
jgi:hypothetical protein